MENLKTEEIKNIKANEIKNENKIITKENEENENDINNDKDELKLREKYTKKYTWFEIIIKSLKFSFLNIKYSFYNFIKSFIEQIIDIYKPILSSKMINSITKKKDYNSLLYYFILTCLLYLLKTLIKETSEVIGLYFIKDSLNNYRNLVIKNMVKKDLEFYDIYRTSEVINKIKDSESIINNNFIIKFFQILTAIVKLFYLLFYLNKNTHKLTYIYFGFTFFRFGSDYILRKYTEFRTNKQKKKLKDNYNVYLNEFVSNIKLVKAMSTEDLELKNLEKLKNRSNIEYGTLFNFISPLLKYIYNIGDLLIVFITGKDSINNKMNYGDLVMFKDYAKQIKKSFSYIKNSIYNFYCLHDDWRRFFEFYDFENRIISLKNYKNEKINFNITFKDVDFSYPLKPDVFIFNNLNLKIESGKITAFVGYSGAGKSTLVNLLVRYYDPCKGAIYIDDINLKDYDIKWYHEHIGLVSQEPILNSGTIEENITYGIKNYDKNKFKKICELTNLDFTNDKNLFPKGIKSKVGEKGSKISGGQKQRIAIARALMREIKLLILDEATSALDAENEKKLQDSIDNLKKENNITIIIIAHRLSTIKNADIIMFLNKGQIIEKGTHSELINKNNEYAKLIKYQLEIKKN